MTREKAQKRVQENVPCLYCPHVGKLNLPVTTSYHIHMLSLVSAPAYTESYTPRLLKSIFLFLL